MSALHRINWVAAQIGEGRDAFFTSSYNHYNRTEKVKFVLQPSFSAHRTKRPGLDIAIDRLRSLVHTHVVIDRGHSSFSTGTSTIAFWIKQVRDDSRDEHTDVVAPPELPPPAPPPLMENVVPPMAAVNYIPGKLHDIEVWLERISLMLDMQHNSTINLEDSWKKLGDVQNACITHLGAQLRHGGTTQSQVDDLANKLDSLEYSLAENNGNFLTRFDGLDACISQNLDRVEPKLNTIAEVLRQQISDRSEMIEKLSTIVDKQAEADSLRSLDTGLAQFGQYVTNKFDEVLRCFRQDNVAVMSKLDERHNSPYLSQLDELRAELRLGFDRLDLGELLTKQTFITITRQFKSEVNSNLQIILNATNNIDARVEELLSDSDD